MRTIMRRSQKSACGSQRAELRIMRVGIRRYQEILILM
jgi:hypothetical protein